VVIEIYERFENLDEEKKQAIINAGFKIFGEYGYSKASVEDITNEAGIAKGSLFYYFGSKKNFFLYLYKYSADKMREVVDSPGRDGKPEYMEKTDFFERLDLIKEKKLKLSKLYPYLGDFIKRAPFEISEEIFKDLQLINQRLLKEQSVNFFDNIDVYKFKEGVDPYMVFQILSWCSEGCANQIRLKNMMYTENRQDQIDFNEVLSLYDRYAGMIRKHFYKEEYL